MTSIDRGSLKPYLSAAEYPTETEAEYTARIRALLPNFPADVVGQWFFDHWQQADDWLPWLDYGALEFSLQAWPTASIPMTDFGYEELFAGHLSRYIAGENLAPRDERILEFFKRYGTWPRPIVVLDSFTAIRERPPWMGTGRYYVLEGNHRIGVFRFAMASAWKLQESHEVWLASSLPAV